MFLVDDVGVFWEGFLKEMELELDPQRWENLTRLKARGGYSQEGYQREQRPGNRNVLYML